MSLVIELVNLNSLALASTATSLLLLLILIAPLGCYITYQRLLHPLANYPGPRVAALTNFWKAYYVYNLRFHEKMVEMHNHYGPVVRVGPNDLHFWSASAIAPIYKAGTSMGKTEFYDAFTTFNPNLFGGRDEVVHSLRRRQLSHGFSQVSIEKMEEIIDGQIRILIDHIKVFSKTGKVFDMKTVISCFVLDILGEVAFGRSFNAQAAGRAEEIEAINDHIFLACVIGELPYQNLLKALLAWSPSPWMRRLIKSRAYLKSTCANCVSHNLKNPSNRPDLLQSLINAKDPETGARLTELDINTEAFAMLVAGSHSTSGTLTFLLWHLLHDPEVLTTVVQEIDGKLGPFPCGRMAYPVKGLDNRLTYLMACIHENFRINPVFSMNLWRRVHSDNGARIGDFMVPHGTNVCISNYVLHHNPEIWGADHNTYNPGRFLDAMGVDGQGSKQCLIPFSAGHRMCIGRNLAMTNILKTTTTLLRMFEFEPVVKGPFWCKVKVRTTFTEKYNS